MPNFPSLRRIGLLLAFLLPSLAGTVAHASTLLVDEFRFGSSAEAGRSWVAKDKTPPATALSTGGLRLTIPFSLHVDRVYWQREVRLDLSRQSGLELRLECPRPQAIRRFMVYLKSGEGWYVWGGTIPLHGDQTLHMLKAEFSTEGKPAGWNRIEAIRISPWKGEAEDTHIVLHRLTARTDSILIVRGSESLSPASERTAAAGVANRISRWLKETGIAHGLLDETELSNAALAGAQVVILPYIHRLKPERRQALGRFMERGGKLIVCFANDPELASMMGFRLADTLRGDSPGRWSAMVFNDPASLHVPLRVFQDSWNIRPALPAARDAKIIAYWADLGGKVSSDPAWTQSSKGFWMSHILLGGDSEGKQQLLLGLLGACTPRVWEPAAAHLLRQAGQIDSFSSLEHALRDIRQSAGSKRADVLQLLSSAEQTHAQAREHYRQGRHVEAVDACWALRRQLTRAYAMVQDPQPGEFRGLWDHNGIGWFPGDWDRSAKILAEHGMNAVLPNLTWGGLAHYPSKVLPSSATVRMHGDQAAQSIAAAHRHGLKAHVWIVCWSLSGAPPDFVERMRKEGRLQVDDKGNTLPWLNPADPRNTSLALDSIRELVKSYPLDGIHLDYVRYPGAHACYSETSRKRFEAWMGRPAAGWPTSAQGRGPLADAYRRFRVEQINLFVRGAYRAVKEINPKVQVSAAVWGNHPAIIHSIGQDWKAWLDQGTVDFVVPMNYTENLSEFVSLLRNQADTEARRARIIPGIGVTAGESQLTADKVIEQIVAARKQRSGGFVLFNLGHSIREETLPHLRLGLTRPQ